MATYSTVSVDGLIIETWWDPYFAGPVKLLITLDQAARPDGKGIPERFIRRLSLQSMSPKVMKTPGSILVVGDWLQKHKPTLRRRVEDPTEFFAYVALFFVLVTESGEKGASRLLANYAAVRPTMARQWIDTARTLGMLTSPIPGYTTGRAQGVLTDKARSILASLLVIEDAA